MVIVGGQCVNRHLIHVIEGYRCVLVTHFFTTPDAPFLGRKLDYFNSGSLSLPSVTLGETIGYI